MSVCGVHTFGLSALGASPGGGGFFFAGASAGGAAFFFSGAGAGAPPPAAAFASACRSARMVGGNVSEGVIMTSSNMVA